MRAKLSIVRHTGGCMTGMPGSPMGIIISVEDSAEFMRQLNDLLEGASED